MLDSSLTLAALFPDETTLQVLDTIAWIDKEGALVPAFWHIEVANGLEMAVRRQRITAAFRDAMLVDVQRWLVTVDLETHLYAWATTKVLVEKHRLTFYDAAYLELALRMRAPLATLDKALRRAAQAEQIVLLGL